MNRQVTQVVCRFGGVESARLAGSEFLLASQNEHLHETYFPKRLPAQRFTTSLELVFDSGLGFGTVLAFKEGIARASDSHRRIRVTAGARG